MLFCYVDESGTCEPYRPADPGSTPVFVLAGITVTSAQQRGLTMDYVRLKKEFEPQLQREERSLSDLIKFEIKGARLRQDLSRERRNRNARRRAIAYLDRTIGLLEQYGCRILGKVVVKAPEIDIDDKKEYPKAIQEIAITFNSQAAGSRLEGIMILDSRTKVKNEGNVHAITTRRFRAGGDYYPNLHEAPVFGHSDTHIPLQIADLLASALIFPIACYQFTDEAPLNRHRHERFNELRDRFGERLASLEHRYVNGEGLNRGGFQVVDSVNHRATHLLFREGRRHDRPAGRSSAVHIAFMSHRRDFRCFTAMLGAAVAVPRRS